MWFDAKDELYVNNSTVAGIISFKIAFKDFRKEPTSSVRRCVNSQIIKSIDSHILYLLK